MKVSRVGNMRYMDRFAIEKLDIPEEILMENAGLASAFVLEQEIGIQDKKFVVFCGVGNNGGDGLVVARKFTATADRPGFLSSEIRKNLKERPAPTGM